MPAVSARSRGVVACSYDDFPAAAGELDLRGDNSPPLACVGATLRHRLCSSDVVASYGPVPGELSLRAALGEIFSVPPDNVIVTAGGSEALHLALTCAGSPDDGVLLPRPAFPGFDQLVALAGLKPAHYDVPGPAPSGPPTSASVRIICTPHNPTGVLTHRADLGQRDDMWTIWDISHMPLFGSLAAEFRSGPTDTDMIVFSLSKLLRLPGARVGCLISGSRELIAAATAVKTHLSMSTSRLSQQLATKVLTDGTARAELHARWTELTALRERLYHAVMASKTLTADPAVGGTHLLLHAADGTDLWQTLKRIGVVGLPGSVFNAPASSVRLCTAQPAHVIDAAARAVRSL